MRKVGKLIGHNYLEVGKNCDVNFDRKSAIVHAIISEEVNERL